MRASWGVDVLTHGGGQIDQIFDLTASTVSLEGLEIILEPEVTGECRRMSLAEGT